MCYLCNTCRKIGEKEAFRKKRRNEKSIVVKKAKNKMIDDSTMMSDRSLPSSTVIDQQRPISVQKAMVIPALQNQQKLGTPSSPGISKENSPRLVPPQNYIPGVTPRINTKTIVYRDGQEHITEATNIPT